MENIIWFMLAAVLIISFAVIVRSFRTTRISLSNQAQAKERGEQLLALQGETNQLLRELIAAVRDKR